MVTKSVILICHNKPEMMASLSKSFNIEEILKIDRKFLRFDGTSFVYRYRLLIKLKPAVVLCERKRIDGQNCRGNGKITKVAYYKGCKVCQSCWANLTSNVYRGREERKELSKLNIILLLLFLSLLLNCNSVQSNESENETIKNFTLLYNQNWEISSNQTVIIKAQAEVQNISVNYDNSYASLLVVKRISLGEYESIFLVGNRTGRLNMTFMVDGINKDIAININKTNTTKTTLNIDKLSKYFKELVRDITPWEMLLVVLSATLFIVCLALIVITKSKKNKN